MTPASSKSKETKDCRRARWRDDCPRGDKLKAEWQVWEKARKNAPYIYVINQAKRAYQAYQQHVDECAICKEVSDA